MSRTFHAPLALLLSASLILTACGGGDEPNPPASPEPSATPSVSSGIGETELNALPLDTERAQVERRYGPPLADPASRVPSRIILDEPKRTSCVYYPVKGGKPGDFHQLCYRNGLLGSKLSLITQPPGTPVVPPVAPGAAP